jgi:hypothetical protein
VRERAHAEESNLNRTASAKPGKAQRARKQRTNTPLEMKRSSSSNGSGFLIAAKHASLQALGMQLFSAQVRGQESFGELEYSGQLRLPRRCLLMQSCSMQSIPFSGLHAVPVVCCRLRKSTYGQNSIQMDKTRYIF